MLSLQENYLLILSKMKTYTDKELEQLHAVLYEILAEIHRICTKYDISYFLIGGSAIGLYYDKGVLPWDDDLDIGMTRENYNKFLKVAEKELTEEYFLSYMDTDPHTPFFYAKVKKNGTLFVEERYKSINMHQGIFVDIFPYDRVPNNLFLREVHYKLANFVKCCFMGKEIWMWKYFGKCQINNPLPRSFFSCLMNRIMNYCISKKTQYKLNVYIQTMFNHWNTEYYNLVVAKINYVPTVDIDNTQTVKFGSTNTCVLQEWEKNLYLNYPNLHRHTKEEQCNHAPLILSFSS